jgi:hypothetical protein
MPDFGIFRGFNEKLFGDKLCAGQLPINLGLIGSTDFSGTDPDALAFFARVTAAGGILSATEQLAIDTLVKQMKTDNIWNSMKAIYPMVGASAAACAQNLKSSSFTGSFTAGWTFSSQGGSTVKGAGSYMDTGLRGSIDLNSSSAHNCYYNNLAITGTANVVIGDGVINSLFMGLYEGSNEFYSANACGFESTPLGSTTAFFLSNKQSATTLKQIKNSLILKSSTVVNTGFTSVQNIYLNNYNSASSFSTGSRCAFASLGDGFTDTQASNFYTAVQAFQTTLSRQV